MFRIEFRLSMAQIEGTVQVGEMFSDQEDLIKALNEAKDKKAVIVSSLRAAMPMLAKVKSSDIEIGVFSYNPQLILFDNLPAKLHSEITPEEKGFELFVHDSDPTLANQK